MDRRARNSGGVPSAEGREESAGAFLAFRAPRTGCRPASVTSRHMADEKGEAVAEVRDGMVGAAARSGGVKVGPA